MNGTDISDWVSAVLFVAAVLFVVVSRFYTKKTDKEKVEVSTADATLKLASGTISLVTERMHKEFERLNKELDEQREDFAEARAQHAKELAQERAHAIAFRKELDEALTEIHTLRSSIREAQAQADKWKKKYDALSGNGNGK